MIRKHYIFVNYPPKLKKKLEYTQAQKVWWVQNTKNNE